MVPSPTPPTGNTPCLDKNLEEEEEGGSLLSGEAVSPQWQKMVEKVEKTIRDLLQSEKSGGASREGQGGR